MRGAKPSLFMPVLAACCLVPSASAYQVGNGTTCWYAHSILCCSAVGPVVWPGPICCDPPACETCCDYKIVHNSKVNVLSYTVPDGNGYHYWECNDSLGHCDILVALGCDEEEPDGCVYDTNPQEVGRCTFCIPVGLTNCP
jgi:hypothetical protein